APFHRHPPITAVLPAMPTFAGYVMTPKHQLEWLRTRYLEIKADEDHIPAANLLFELIRKHKMLSIFRLELVALPGPPDTDLIENGNLNRKRMAIMFVRRTCTGDKVGWIPQREIPGVASDGRVGQYLKSIFRLELVALPGPPDTDLIENGNLNRKRMAIMFVRRTCTGDKVGWIPQREIPGVASDGRVGQYLKRWGLVTSDWVVLHMPVDDPFRSFWVLKSTITSHNSESNSLDHDWLGGDLWAKLRWPSWSFVLVPATFLLTSYLVLKRARKANLALSLAVN
ncbi:unnamed protein product, partial [Rhizoctonia solani]